MLQAKSAAGATDADVDAADQDRVKLLVQAECASTRMPTVPPMGSLGFLSPLMQKELCRIEQQEPLGAIDTTRYRLPEPTLGSSKAVNTDADADAQREKETIAWKSAVLNARSQLEFQTTRLSNLGSLQELGKEAYQCHIAQCRSMIKSLQYELFRISNQMD